MWLDALLRASGTVSTMVWVGGAITGQIGWPAPASPMTTQPARCCSRRSTDHSPGVHPHGRNRIHQRAALGLAHRHPLERTLDRRIELAAWVNRVELALVLVGIVGIVAQPQR
jgi:hypothetical protein